MTAAPPISAADKLACAKRELVMRHSVYPRWIASGKMSETKAAHEIAVMRAIVADYQAAVEGGAAAVMAQNTSYALQWVRFIALAPLWALVAVIVVPPLFIYSLAHYHFFGPRYGAPEPYRWPFHNMKKPA